MWAIMIEGEAREGGGRARKRERECETLTGRGRHIVTERKGERE